MGPTRAAVRCARVLAARLVILVLAGCATAYSRGQGALRAELDDFERAADALGDPARQAPTHPDARRSRGLASLRLGRDDAAADALRRVVVLGPHPRLIAQTERALGLLQRGPDEELRAGSSTAIRVAGIPTAGTRAPRAGPEGPPGGLR